MCILLLRVKFAQFTEQQCHLVVLFGNATPDVTEKDNTVLQKTPQFEFHLFPSNSTGTVGKLNGILLRVSYQEAQEESLSYSCC